jgi:hypothetical protein
VTRSAESTQYVVEGAALSYIGVRVRITTTSFRLRAIDLTALHVLPILNHSAAVSGRECSPVSLTVQELI